jgi:hypothetical protein
LGRVDGSSVTVDETAKPLLVKDVTVVKGFSPPIVP